MLISSNTSPSPLNNITIIWKYITSYYELTSEIKKIEFFFCILIVALYLKNHNYA